MDDRNRAELPRPAAFRTRWFVSCPCSRCSSARTVRFPRDRIMATPDLRRLIGTCGFSLADRSHRLDDARYLEYCMIIPSQRQEQAAQLARALEQTPSVAEFRIAPTGD